MVDIFSMYALRARWPNSWHLWVLPCYTIFQLIFKNHLPHLIGKLLLHKQKYTDLLTTLIPKLYWLIVHLSLKKNFKHRPKNLKVNCRFFRFAFSMRLSNMLVPFTVLLFFYNKLKFWYKLLFLHLLKTMHSSTSFETFKLSVNKAFSMLTLLQVIRNTNLSWICSF